VTVQTVGTVLAIIGWMTKAAQALAVVLSVALLSYSVSRASAEAETLQPQAQFESAIRNRSTSPNLILFTMVDDRTGDSLTGCTLAPLLLGAILKERDPQQRAISVQEAVQIALSNTSHVFHFSRQSALDNLRDMADGKYSRACGVLKQSGCVQRQDLTGAFVAC
jgi:hypothetical protein